MDKIIQLKDYVPLFQTLLWLLLIIVFFIIFRKKISIFINIIIERIKQGSSVKVAGLEIGEELRNNLDYKAPSDSNEDNIKTQNGNSREIKRTQIYKDNNGIFITHLISPSKKVGQKFDIFIYLIRHNIDNFDDVEYAEFFFGHMWGNKVFREKYKNGYIGISTSAYNPFLCICTVKFKNGAEINLNRYIDFEISKQIIYN